jgi:hypothetical protein
MKPDNFYSFDYFLKKNSIRSVVALAILKVFLSSSSHASTNLPVSSHQQKPVIQQPKVVVQYSVPAKQTTPLSSNIYKPTPVAPSKPVMNFNPLPQTQTSAQQFNNSLKAGNAINTSSQAAASQKSNTTKPVTTQKQTSNTIALPLAIRNKGQQTSNSGAGSLNTNTPVAHINNGQNTTTEIAKGAVKGVSRIIPDAATGVGVGLVAVGSVAYYGAKTQSLGETAEKTNAAINSYQQSAEKSNAALVKKSTGLNIQPSNSTQQIAATVTEVALPVVAGVGISNLAKVSSMSWVEQTKILQSVAKGKGLFGLGQASTAESNALGEAWVGKNSTIAKNGTTMVSSDGTRVYRPPVVKDTPYATTGMQANFERLTWIDGKLRTISNGHLDVTK